MANSHDQWDAAPNEGETSRSVLSDTFPEAATAQGWLGGYHLLRKIGSGGTGTVWEAADEGGHRVALKLLHPAIADTNEARKRLLRETRLVNQIRSDGVSRVVDVEAEAFSPFVVTELIEGPTLDRLIRNGGLSTEETLELALSLADILDAVHDAGVAHRDLKPSNIVMGPNGPVLIDFGIAQSTDDSRITQTGSVTGTPGYVAPEILREGGEPVIEQWQHSDWFAWAGVLLSARTGRPPFGGGSTHAILHRLFEGSPDTDGLPARVARAFRMALNPEPLLRSSSDTLLAALEGEDEVPEATAVMVPPPSPTTATNLASLPGPVVPSMGAGGGPLPVHPMSPEATDFFAPAQVDAAGLPFGYVYRHPYPKDTWVLSVLLLVALGTLPIHFGHFSVLVGAGVLALFQFIGRTEVHVATRRNRFGSPRKSDGVVAGVASPWNLLTAVLVLLPSLVAGAIAYLLVLILANVVGAPTTGVPIDLAPLWNWVASRSPVAPPAWQLVTASIASLLVAWIMPTSRWARIGLARLFAWVAPTRRMQLLWGSLFVAAFIFLVAL